MDREKLIRSVFLRPPLWDKFNRNHHNSVVLPKLWKEVANECESSTIAVKSAWKKLRETFGKKLAEIPSTKSGDDDAGRAAIKSEWPFFNSLLFLHGQFTLRGTSGNFTNEETEQATQDVDQLSEDAQDFDSLVKSQEESETLSQVVSLNSRDRSASPVTSSLTTANYVKQKIASEIEDPIGEALLKAVQEKINYLKRKEERRHVKLDEDAAFFHSVLPHVRTLTTKQKLTFRIKLLQLLDEITTTDNRNPPSTSAASNQSTKIHYIKDEQYTSLNQRKDGE